MADSSSEFEHESLQDADSIVTYLETLAHGFRSRRLLFSSGKREMMLRPDGLIKLNVRAKKKQGKAKVTLSVTWKETEPEQESSVPLVIHVPEAKESH